jgi:phosphoribosylaminoimidazole-succinocarboxamide synthase
MTNKNTNTKKMNLAVFSSGTGTTSCFIAKHIPQIQSIARQVFFVENNQNFNDLAGKLTPEFEVIPTNIPGNDYSQVLANLDKHQINLVFLAGWMHICPQKFLMELEARGIEIVNLHPSLPYQLIGRDIHPKIWAMYEEGMVTRTGAMVHRVSPDVDRGEVIATRELDLRSCATYEDYLTKMRGSDDFEGIEKHVCLDAITKLAADFQKQQSLETFQKQDWILDIGSVDMSLVHRGKVRDSYVSRHYPDWLFINTTDRVSANDIILTHVPTKGYFLNQINQFWHRLFSLSQLVSGTQGSTMVVRRFQPIPLEFIIRNKLWGSMWSAYQGGQRDFNGLVLPDGLEKGSVFPDGPIFTPTTKGKKDRPITEAEILAHGIVSRAELAEIKRRCLELFHQGADYLGRLGIEMIDTKFEMAFDSQGQIHFIDEIFTPDSSRFIIHGRQMDKDALRKWTTENEAMILSLPIGSDGTRVGLELPESIANGLANNYQRFYELITMGRDSLNAITSVVSGEMLPTRCAILIAGSEADWAHIAKLRQELAARGILSVNYYSSAHKRTLATMEIINKWNLARQQNPNARYVYITCAGMSNALSGVVAANSRGIPVIACPPAKDLDDQQTNINSTLQMPSAVPAACILRPDNVAGFCINLLRC